MTTTDLVMEIFRSRLPRMVRDIVRKEMRDMLGPAKEVHSTWDCSWCGYRNIRFNAGLDHCSVCGAETFTYFIGANDLRVKYSRHPKEHGRTPHRFKANRRKGTRQAHLDCRGPCSGSRAGCVNTTTYSSPSG